MFEELKRTYLATHAPVFIPDWFKHISPSGMPDDLPKEPEELEGISYSGYSGMPLEKYNYSQKGRNITDKKLIKRIVERKHIEKEHEEAMTAWFDIDDEERVFQWQVYWADQVLIRLKTFRFRNRRR